MNISELKQKLVALGINEKTYAINSMFGDEQYCLEKIGVNWHCYYSERGLKTGEKTFSTESSACDYFYKLLKKDPTVRF